MKPLAFLKLTVQMAIDEAVMEGQTPHNINEVLLNLVGTTDVLKAADALRKGQA
jgi:hypothetical protein